MHSHEIDEHRTSNPRAGSSNLSERAISAYIQPGVAVVAPRPVDKPSSAGRKPGW
jgi:hypothetical protein